MQSLLKKGPNIALNAWTQQSDSGGGRRRVGSLCHFAAFKRLEPCLDPLLINFATFYRKTKIDVLLCLIYIFFYTFEENKVGYFSTKPQTEKLKINWDINLFNKSSISRFFRIFSASNYPVRSSDDSYCSKLSCLQLFN